MIDPVRTQLALVTNSRPSSRRSSFVLRRSKPFAVSKMAHILPTAGSQKTPHHDKLSSFPRLPVPCSLWLVPDSSNKTHTAQLLQRFSPIHF
jgi:hypothetical protein